MHKCNKSANGKGWSICQACDGRIHLQGCTSKRDPKKDCCRERHEVLWGAGQTFGIHDASLPMIGTNA